LHDAGTLLNDRPRDVQVASSRHRCSRCRLYFSADLSDLAPPGSHYTHRVISLAVRLVDKLLPATSNAVERGNRRHRKMQKAVYRVRRRKTLKVRIALDMQRDQRAAGRRKTVSCLRDARKRS
jgi:hypothetical protein